MSSLACVDASLIIRTLVPGPFTDRALALMTRWPRDEVGLVAPARVNDCECWTADENLYRAVKDDLDCVRWIGDDRP